MGKCAYWFAWLVLIVAGISALSYVPWRLKAQDSEHRWHYDYEYAPIWDAPGYMRDAHIDLTPFLTGCAIWCGCALALRAWGKRLYPANCAK